MTEKKGCFEKACHPRLRAGISSLALFAAFALSACTDYVEEYEAEYRADYGNADVFERRLNDVSKWDWNSVCQSGDAIWEWCFESDGKYALATFAGASWNSFVDGDARLVFSGTDNAGHSYTTNLLTEDNILHMLRHSGGLRVEVSMASGDFSTGVQVKLQNDELDKPIYPAMLLRYTNECGDAFAGLKYVDGDGNVVSEYRWDKLAVGEQLSLTLKFDDLHYVSGQRDSEFLKKANTFEVGLSGCSDTHKGVMVYAVGIVYDSKNEGKSSSSEGGSNGGTTNSNGGSNDKSSSSVSSNGSTASSSSAGTSNGSTATSSSVGTSNGNTASSSSVDNHDYGFLWRGVDKNNYVETDFGSDPWTDYTDSRDQTKILRPQNSYDICFGQCGLVSFGTGYVDGNNTTAPYASISFVISNGREEDVLDKWGGVCVTYASNDTATLYLSIGAEDSVYGYGMPMAKLLPTADKDSVLATVQLKWDEFHQPDWAKKVISGPDVAKILRKIQINFDGKYGGYGETQYFNIYEIGSYGKCGPTQDKNIPTWSRSKFYAAIDSSKLNIEPYAALIDKKNLLWYGGNKIKGGTSYRVQAGLEYDYPNYEYDSYLQFAEDNADKRISNCNGSVCGTVKHSIVEGGAQFRTAAIFFDFASSTNLKEWGGLCVTYSSDKKMWLQLGRSGTSNIIDTVTLVPTDNALVDTCFSWLDFGAYTYGATLKDGRYLDKVNSVKFRFLPESYDANFKIVAIGKCTECKSELAWDFLNPDITYDTIIDSRDKQPYKYVRIGNYEWMAENLNYDGSEGVCSGNNPKNCAKYGRLYPPDKNVCPAGWHLPIKEEFDDLVTLAGGEYPHGHKLRSLSGWEKPGTDDYGFSAAPGGYANSVGDMINLTKEASFWGTLNDTSDTWYDYMRIYYTGDLQVTTDVSSGRKSIRCVKGNYVNACRDDMPTAAGTAHNVTGNTTGSISGTRWRFNQWYSVGSGSMTYFDNGTFKANWTNVGDYMVRVGYFYDKNGSGVNVDTTHYSADYRYTKAGASQYGYIGAYGWTVNPMVEFYIVDDWYTKPVEQYIGPKQGEITVDGATYSIHTYVRDQESTEWGISTYLQIFSVRETPRQCGHINIQAHFDKWNELFKGQTASLPGSKGAERSIMLKFGNVISVNLLVETGGTATGSVEYTYFNMSE